MTLLPDQECNHYYVCALNKNICHFCGAVETYEDNNDA